MIKNKILLTISLLAFSLFLIQFISAVEQTIVVEDYELTFKYQGVEEDDKFSLRVNIKNTAEEDKLEVKFELDSNDPFDTDGDEDWEIGILGADEDVTKTFRIEVDDNTKEGEYDLEFILEDSEDDFDEELEIEVDSNEADLIIGGLKSTPSIISPDLEDMKLELFIENIGGGDANFVRGKLLLPKGVSSSNSYSDLINLGTIESGAGKMAEFFLDTDRNLPSGPQIGILVLDYKSEIKTTQQRLEFLLPVKGTPLFEIDLSSASGELIPGGSGKLRINIKNVGEEKGEETSVRVFENSDHPFDFDEKTNFIGNLDKDESGTAIFSFNIDENSHSNKYIIKVQIRTVDNGNVIVSEYSVPIKVKPAQKTNFTPILLLIIPIILIVVLIFLFSKRRKVIYPQF
jgi:hypothetical protein